MSDDAPRDDTSRDNAPRDNAFIGNSNRDNDYSDHDYSDNSGGDNGSRNERDSLTVVGIGASAGGLGTLQNFLEVMPPDSGAAFVVVIHLAPDQESSFAELLAPRTTMSVLQVNDNRRLEPNHVYVISPGHNLVVADGEVRLEPLETRRVRRAPIDYFFRSLAEAYQDRAIGVILTGSGSDGSVGLGLIKEQGGLTLAQDPNEAEFAEMPRSAVATGQVDEVLPLSGIAQQISAYIDNRDRVEVPTREDALSGEDAEALEQIVDLLYEHASHDFSHYRRPTLLRRIRRRLQIRGTPTLSGYLDYLRLEPAEARILYHDLLITVTNFFRDPDAFAALKAEVIPKLFEGKGIGGQVRVWSIGCATGEEAYSLAILLHEHAATLRTPPALRVFATDVSQDVLDRARDGRYPREIVNDVSAERIERFFSIDEGGGYRVNRNVRETIVFSHHNLLADPPFSHLDLVVCRNMLIYLQRDLQRGIYELFHYALEPETFLFLGMSESVDENDLFQPVDKRHKIYRRQKVNAARPRLPTLPLQSPDNASRDRTASAAASSTKPPADPTGYGALHHQMVERYAPPSLLVDQDYDIVHYSENVGRYLRQPGGEPTDDVLQRVPASLRAGLRAALHAAFRKKEPTRSRPTPVDIEGQKRTVVFWVRPTDPVKKPPQSFALVIFDDSETRVTPDRSPTANPDGSQTERELEEELEVTRTRLDEVLEEYEISQEEMRAANEELQSMNEELKSTAEELETSKEELQSANEELVIANQENRHKVEELSAFADDLHNLLMATDIAIIFLDRDLRIKRFTPRAHDLFNILRVDLGRPLDHFTNRFGDDDVVSDAREVLRRLVPIEREITNDDRRDYLLRMLPYRTAEDRIDGVVISLVDITDLKQTERELQQLTAELEGRVEARTEQVRGLMSALSLAEQRERARIAQVLHDDVQQMLFALQMKFRQLQKNSPDSLAERYDDANDLLKQAFQMVRTLSVGLNPPLLKEEGLEAALRWVGEQMEETYDLTLSLDIDLGDAPPLEQGRQLLLYHASRELLFNVIKHAEVTTARLTAQVRDSSVCIEIADDGVGFDGDAALDHDTEGENREGFGMYSIRERLRLFGGSLDVASKTGEGTVVTVTMPIEASESQSGERAR